MLILDKNYPFTKIKLPSGLILSWEQISENQKKELLQLLSIYAGRVKLLAEHDFFIVLNGNAQSITLIASCRASLGQSLKDIYLLIKSDKI